jgi:purine nucleoside permease
MTRREKHNIKSNCVTFEDDCYNETSSYDHNITAMDRAEVDAFRSVYKTGESFVKEITAKIKQAIGV